MAPNHFPLQSVSMHNTRTWTSKYFLVLGRLLLVKHISLGSGALAIDKSVPPDANHYEGKVLPTESVNFQYLVSPRVWGITPSSVLKVLRVPDLGDPYVEQDVRRMTPLPQITGTRTTGQFTQLRVVSSNRFALGSGDGYLIRFLELAGKDLERTMIERWVEERLVENILGTLTSKCTFRVLP